MKESVNPNKRILCRRVRMTPATSELVGARRILAAGKPYRIARSLCGIAP